MRTPASFEPLWEAGYTSPAISIILPIGPALLDAFETTSHAWYLDRAHVVTDRLLSQFWDEALGGFFTGMNHEGLIHQMKSAVDRVVSSGNAVAVQVLLRLFSLTGA